jgi:hypothetical protein
MANEREDDDLPIEEDSLPEREEVEVIVGDASEEKPATSPDVVVLKPEEFEKLRSQGDATAALARSFEGLADRLAGATAPPPPANAPEQTIEEFYAEHSDDLFDREKGAKAFAEATRRVVRKEYEPLLSSMGSQLALTRKELLESRDPYFKKYASEVEQLVSAQPAAVRIQPNIYEQAWDVVRKKHQAEIDAESVKTQVDEAVAAKLKELGIEPGKPAARPAAYENSSMGSRGGSPASPARRPIRLPDEATKQRLMAEAERKGLDFETYLTIKGY